MNRQINQNNSYSLIEKENVTEKKETIKSKSRLFFIDNLRILLTFLVIAHHVFITYAHTGTWYFKDSASPDTLLIIIGSLFCGINAIFFMDCFFFIAGYFTPKSYDKKGFLHFIKDRIIRLGIPLLVYIYFLNPLIMYIIFTNTTDYRASFIEFLFAYPIRHAGPLWFIAVLIFFTLVYAIWRNLSARIALLSKHNFFEKGFPRNSMILLAIIGIAIFTFLTRIFYPVDTWTYIFLWFDFGSFPQYIVFFSLGILTYRGDWLEKMPSTQKKQWTIVAIVGIAFFVLLVLLIVILSYNADLFSGGLTWESLFYSFLDTIMTTGIIIGLITIFQKKFNLQTSITKELSNSTYTVYIFHTLIIVTVSITLNTVIIYPLLKFFIVLTMIVPTCFISASIIRRVLLVNECIMRKFLPSKSIH